MEMDAAAGSTAQPAFEMVVLGSGGGPLETDTSGYLVKPVLSRWEDGILALEGGSGLGALAAIFERTSPTALFPGFAIPETHNTPVLQAAYVFSFLSCYLITHAHLDHCLSLILLSGSVPTRPKIPALKLSHTSSSAVTSDSKSTQPSTPPELPRPPVYATRKTLERLAMAYGGELWPELGMWAPASSGQPKRRKLEEKRGSMTGDSDQMGSSVGTGVVFSPIPVTTEYTQLHPTLPITTRKFHVLHGCTSKGQYESSAMFFRFDPSVMAPTPVPEEEEGMASVRGSISAPSNREFLFFGDVESDWRRKGEESWDEEGQAQAKAYNEAIWTEAADSWDHGRLAGVFIECSYDSDRPAHLMFGHVCPPALYYELQRLAGKVKTQQRPLQGLRIFVTHIKDSLAPHPSGKTARERIMQELRALETEGQLGVVFVEVKKGDRILI